MWPVRENWSDVMPSLKAEGSLRPETRWKLRSLGAVSMVDRDMPEKRLRKAEGTRLALGGAWSCRGGGAWLIAGSFVEGWLSVSWRAPPCLRLWRRSRIKMMAKISAAPARLPTTLPTTCGVSRGRGPVASDSFAAELVAVEEAPVAIPPAAFQPGPPLP